MADVTVKRVEDFEAIYGGAFRRVRAGLGVSSFGMAVMDFPPNADRYPQHDESETGHEEVYTALSGRALLHVGDEVHVLEPGVFARVGAGEVRKITTEDQPARVLALGGAPGRAYEPPLWTEPGQPDPIGG